MTLTRPAFDAAVLAEVCLRPRLLLGWVGRIAFIVPDSRPSVDPPLAAAALPRVHVVFLPFSISSVVVPRPLSDFQLAPVASVVRR